MGHKSAHVILRSILLSGLVFSLFGLVSRQDVQAQSLTPAIITLANDADIVEVAAAHEAVVSRSIPALGLFLLESSRPDLHTQLANDVRVTAVYENAVIEGQPRYSGAVGQELMAQPWGPGSALHHAYNEQWAVFNIRLPQAHTISRGEGVTVAVLDTGIDRTHPLFEGKLTAGYDFVDDDPEPDETRNGLDEDGDSAVDEGAGHGTHVAGIVALTAPQTSIMPIRVFDDEGRGDYFHLVAGLIYAVDQGADVINLSGSGPDDEPYLAEAITYAQMHGVLVVAAGGVNTLGYPASYPTVISVGAADARNYPTDFSNFSAMANTIYAPGLSILSGYDDGGFASWTGNSMAAPFVAGTAALLLSSGACDAAYAAALLVETAHPVVADPKTPAYFGRLDAFDALAAATQQVHTDLSVLVLAGEMRNPQDIHLRPHFNIVNKGNSLPLSELTLRYWFTAEGQSGQVVDCDYAAIQCREISSQVGSTPQTAVADAYLELQFLPGAGVLLGSHESGPIQLRVHKADWTPYDELNDYSYNGTSVFTQNQRVTLYRNGELVWGTEPSGAVPIPAPPPAPPAPTAPAASGLRVQYRTNDTDPGNNVSKPQFQLINDSGSAVPFTELRLRYWFTEGETAVVQAACDYAALGNDRLTAVTGKTGNRHYLDITFAAAAGQLNAGASSGEIHMRLNLSNWQPLNENDDYSFSPAHTAFSDWQRVTLYRNGQLVWGVEP